MRSTKKLGSFDTYSITRVKTSTMLPLAISFLPLGLVAFAAAQDPTWSACAPAQTLTTFSWFNSSLNLDCLNRNFPSDAVWCWNRTDAGAVESCVGPDARYLHYGTPPGPGECAACYPLCGGPTYTVPDQTEPFGFGPPDRLTSNLCSYQSPPPSFLHVTEIGNGALFCGAGSYPPVQFVGDSNQDEGATGRYRVAPAVPCADENGATVYPTYQAEFPLHCTRDAENNATCTTDLPVELPLIGTGSSPGAT